MSKNKVYCLSLAVGVALIVAALFMKNKDSNVERAELTGDEAEEEIKKDETALSGGNYLEGVLRNSEDASRGNLKLISKLGDIYLKTSRDFSNLVGLEVLVLINGTQDSFELVDIQSKVAKDGFIMQQ